MFDKDYVLNLACDILSIDSPSGFTHGAMTKLNEYSKELGYNFWISSKGTGVLEIPGRVSQTVALSAHIDTLGLMVRAINTDGTLALTNIGAPIIPTFDGEYCQIYTRKGKIYTGTVLCNSTSLHVYTDAMDLKRELQNMHVRIDEITSSKDETLELGISSGDYICIDTKTQVTESGFIKSRFLDDKLGVAAIFGVLKKLKDGKLRPVSSIKIFFSSYEEQGHGLSWVTPDIHELVAVDMGCIGSNLSCTEQQVSICAKDSTGPYNYELTNRLIDLAERNKIDYAVDIYPSYGSDVSAALKSGWDIKGALIGPGVAASHGMERSHYNGVYNTMKLIFQYILADPEQGV